MSSFTRETSRRTSFTLRLSGCEKILNHVLYILDGSILFRSVPVRSNAYFSEWKSAFRLSGCEKVIYWIAVSVLNCAYKN